MQALGKLFVTTAALALLLAGCSFSNKTAAGTALHNAPRQLSHAPGVQLRVTFGSRLLKRGALMSVPAPDPGVSWSGVMDPRTGASSYAAPGATSPAVAFSGTRVFARTPHAGPQDARPWLSTTLDKDLQDGTLDPSAVPPSLAAYALRPSVLTDLLSGALTGSIHNRGPSTVDGVSLTQYDVRFDLAQAFDNATRVRYSQKQIDDIDKVLGVLGIKSDSLADGSVWLDAKGNPRRVVVHLRQSPVTDSLLLLDVDLRLTPTNVPVTVAVPNDNTVVTVPSLFQMLVPFKGAMGSKQ